MGSTMGLDEFREMIKQPGFYPLLPRHRVYLFAPVPSTEDEGKRFARLFIETWKRIPLGPRRAILRHWRNRERIPLAHSPLIQLLGA